MTSLLLRAATLASSAAVAVGAVAAAAPPAADSPRGVPPGLGQAVAVPRVADPPLRASTSAGVAAALPSTRPGTVAVAPRARWVWPLAPRPEVVRPFIRPATRYGVGHRGVDLGGRVGQAVLAVDDGVVSHVGVVAGRGTVTVLHASGLRSTYEPVDATVQLGQAVTRGSAIGSLAETGSGSHCGALACLHLGAIRAADYLDPLALLGGGRVRLLPLR